MQIWIKDLGSFSFSFINSNQNGNGPTPPGATSPKILLPGLYYELTIINLSSLQSTISFSHNKTRHPTLVHNFTNVNRFSKFFHLQTRQ